MHPANPGQPFVPPKTIKLGAGTKDRDLYREIRGLPSSFGDESGSPRVHETGILGSPVVELVVSHLSTSKLRPWFLVTSLTCCASSAQSCRLSLLYPQALPRCMCYRQFSHVLPTDPFFQRCAIGAWDSKPISIGVVYATPLSFLGPFGIGHCMEF
jgi:hypothetical protein